MDDDSRISISAAGLEVGHLTLRELRESNILNQTQVAAFLGVNVATVSNWERGVQQPRFFQIQRMAELFKTTPQAVQEAVNESSKG